MNFKLLKIIIVPFIAVLFCTSSLLFSQNLLRRVNRYNSDNKAVGRWVYYNQENNKILSKGRFRNGIPVGRWIINNEEGIKFVKKRYFKNRTREVWYYPSGSVECRGWSKLILDDPLMVNYYWDGKWKFYNENGKLDSVKIYRQGMVSTDCMTTEP
ncbi:MAG: hypothetical protein PHT69_05410 [Bacteroidales bacterium]|nr:hypothetical protein [Bacteroidales bacterium]